MTEHSSHPAPGGSVPDRRIPSSRRHDEHEAHEVPLGTASCPSCSSCHREEGLVRCRWSGVGWMVVLCVLGVLCSSAWTPRAQETPTDTIRIGIQKNGGYDIVTLPLETYVARVLAGEALPGSDPAALEALAIAVRTYTAANRGKHRADGFDLCDQTHCQVMRAATADTDRAAAATAGAILMYDGAPASIYYSASCGGRTERPSNVWPGADDPPYLPAQDD